jgi:hypothetical protein
MAKHLCGVATDLALRSLETFVDHDKVSLKYIYCTTHTPRGACAVYISFCHRAFEFKFYRIIVTVST